LGRIKVAIVGVGNCCSALVQGIYSYMNGEKVGLIHEKVGDYSVSDLEIVAAFDVDTRKVGKELSRAIFAEPNKTPKMVKVPKTGVIVQMGHFSDEFKHNGEEVITLADEDTADLVSILKEKKVDVVLNAISGSALKSSEYYAEAALNAGCTFINTTPAPITSEGDWAEKYKEAGIPLIGDDILDQIGATVVHIGILEFLNSRGVHIDESYQLDVGGGAESVNTLWKTRKLKREIKTSAVSKAVPYDFPLVSGSTDYVDFLGNNRDSFFWFKGRYFGGASFNMDIKLTTADAPNSGSVIFDVIRGAKIAIDKKDAGLIHPLCSYGFKSPLEHKNLAESYTLFKNYVGA